MGLRKLRHRFAAASSLAAAATAATLLIGMGTAGTASAAITVPAFPTFGTYPNWLPSDLSVSHLDVAQGSDTTLFVMQSISDLYSQAGIFPFSCQLTTAQTGCLSNSNNVTNNPNNTQSDTVDNFAGTEELQGVNDVGSGNGQGMLCGTQGPTGTGAVTGITPDYARSSKPFGVAGCAGQGFGFAKDGVTAVDFQSINPSAYISAADPASGYAGKKFVSYTSTGTAVQTTFPGGATGAIGPVAAGWLPSDPTNCVANIPVNVGGSAPLCSGTAFNDVDNTATPGSSLTAASSIAYRLWCYNEAVQGSATAGEQQITDWGQLTNLSAAANGGTAQQVGNGAPIGVPIRIIGVNGSSGTASTFFNFAKSGIGSGNCTTSATNGVGGNYNANAAQGQNPNSPQGISNNLEIALENDANQIGDFANANWGAADPADQAIDIATSLYFMGNGAFLSNPNASVADLEATSNVPANTPTAFQASELNANNNASVTAGSTIGLPVERSNSWAMSRTLFNIILPASVKASVGGFLNWMCDGGGSNTINGSTVAPDFAKGTDHIDGGNFDTDLGNIITNQFDYSRLTDTTQELPLASQVTANGVTNQNGTCEATQSIPAGDISSSSATVTLSATVPTTIQTGWPVYIPSGYSLKLPAGTTVSSVSGSTIALSNAPVAGTSGAAAPTTLYFPGHPPVLAVGNATS